VYKDNVLNGFGVVRFTRGASDGTSGKYLEMYKRCTSADCSAADTTPGFVTDWTNSQTTATSTAFTIFMVLKTYQSQSDTNPMGIINLVTAGAKTGLGLFKTEAKCFLYAGTLAAQTGDTLVNAVVFKAAPTAPATTPSAVPRTYEGSSIVIYGQAQDAQTKVYKTSSRCTVARYLLVGQLTADVPIGAQTTITIRGGRGKVGGDDEAGTNGFATPADISAGTVNVRFGTIAGGAAGMPGDVAVTLFAAGGALGADTVLSVAVTPLTVVPAGTSIFIGIGTEFHLARLSGCTATGTQATDAPFDIVPAGYRAPDCPPSTTRQLSTLSAYYGGVADDAGDSGCGSECGAAGGCDPAGGKFGTGGTCANKWGSGRALQDPSAKWRIVALVASGNELRGYVDGLHDGCAAASGPCSVAPPMAITTATAVALNNLRLGLMDTQALAGTDYATMDLAEMMVYDRALTAPELDRVGNYLATKFDLPHFRLNDDPRSPTRSVALSRSLGCPSALRRKETGRLCEGLAAAACTVGPTQVTLSAGADATDDFYVGRRLTVRGGGDSTDASGIKSANGQSCLITNYVGATKLADCDFTSLGSSYVLWSGASYPPVPGYEAVTAFDATLQVAWAPAMPPPYYALIGDPARRRAVVRVTAVSAAGTGFRLTVERGLGSTVRSPVATADSARTDAHGPNTITYARSYLAGDATAPPAHTLPGATSLLAGSLGPYAPALVSSVSNWRAQLSAPGSAASAAAAATEAVQVVSAAPVTFTVANALTTVATTVTLTADTPFNALPANALLQLGDLTSGEVVTVSPACTVAALTGSGLTTSTCVITRWIPSASRSAVVAGTKATWVSYNKPSTPPLISFTLDAALSSGALAMTLSADTGFSTLAEGDVLLVGSEAIKIAAACILPAACTVVRGQSMAQWGAATTATNSATMTTAAAASVGAKAFLVSRAKGVALSDAMDSASLSFLVANTGGLAVADAVVTLTSKSPFALALLSAGDLLQVGTEVLSVTGPCTAASSTAQLAAVCTSTPLCASTGCSCGTCPVARAQLGSTAAAAAAAAVVTIARRGSTYANPVALHLYPAFTLYSPVYPDGGTGGGGGTVTLVGATPAATCTAVGSGYSTLPTSVVIGQSRTSNAVQPTGCTGVTFVIAAGVAGSGTVTVTAAGSASGCIGGVYDLLFLGGSGTLTPGTCTLALAAGVHTAAISPVGAGYSVAPTVSFETGTQPRGCLATLSTTVAAGALVVAAPTVTTVDGCLFGTAATLAFSAPTVTPAVGTYTIPGLLPVTSPALNVDGGAGYAVDLANLAVTVVATGPAVLVASCLVLTTSAGTNAGKIKVTVGGTSMIDGAGCMAGVYTFQFAYSGFATPVPTPPATATVTIALPAISYTTIVAGCTAFPCADGIPSGPGQTLAVTIAQPAGCDLSFTTANIGAAWDISVSAGTGVGCIIGTFPAVFTIGGAGGTPPLDFNVVFTGAVPTFGAGLAGCVVSVCDNLGANYVVLPTVTIGADAITPFTLTQPSTCVVTFTVAVGSAAGTIQITAIGGASAALGEGCLIGTYGLTFTNGATGVGSLTGGTITFAPGTVAVAFSAVGANYPARPRLAMGGQPNSCTATADSSLTFTAATGAFTAGPATFGGGTLAGCLISSTAFNLDISAGATEPAVGYYTIAAGALGAIQVTATGFGYSAFPSPVLAPTGTDGQAGACTLTALTTSSTALTDTGIAAGALAGPVSVPSVLSGCTTGAFSVVFTKPQTYSLAVTADTPVGTSALGYNDLLLIGQEVVRVAGPCTAATPPVCPVIRGQLSTTPGAHGPGAKSVRIRRSPAPPATPSISFAHTGLSAAASTTLAVSASTWFPASSLAYGDTLLIRTVIVECRAAGCGTIARPMSGTVDVAFSDADVVRLLPATSITFTLTSILSVVADGRTDTIAITPNQPSVVVADLKDGDMLLINSELVQLRGDCAASPCAIVRGKGGTTVAAAAVNDRAVLVRRVNGRSLTAPITFKVSNALGLSAGDAAVTMSASTDFAVTSLAAKDVLIVAAEFLQLSGPCSPAGVCPVLRGVTYGGFASTAAAALLNAVVTLIRRPSSPPPAATEVVFSVAAAFGAWGLVGLGDCPDSTLTGCGLAVGCKGSCPSTPSMGHTLLQLTADGPYGLAKLAEHELLMVGTELVRVTGPCHALGCPVRRAQQHSEYNTQALSYANRRSKAVLVTASAVTFTVSNALVTAATTVTLTADTSVNVAALAANTLLLIGSEVVRVNAAGCSAAASIWSCGIDRAQLTPAGIATTDPLTSYAVGTKLTLLDQGLQRGYSAAAGAQLDLAYVPQAASATSTAFAGGRGGAATYSIERCDPTAMPAAREAPIQIVVGNEYLKAPGANFGGSYTYDAMTGGNAFWVDGGGATSFTAETHGAAGGGSIVEIKGWDLLPTDMDLAYDGAVTFTLSGAVASGAASFALMADVESFAVQALALGDYLLIGTEIVQVNAAASAGPGLATAAAVGVSRGEAGTVAVAYADGTQAMLLGRANNGISTALVTFTIAAANVDDMSVTVTAAGTLRQGDLLLVPTTGEVVRITSPSCVTACTVARGQPTPLGVATASALTSTSLIFLKRPATVAPGPVAFTLATTPLLAAESVVTLTSAADPVTFRVLSGPDGVAAPTAADTEVFLSADTAFAVAGLAVGDVLLVGSEIVTVSAASSQAALVTVTRAQLDANGAATTAAVMPVGAVALLLDAARRPRRLLGLPRSGFPVGALTEGDVLAVGTELLRVMGPCGLNGAASAPAAADTCPVQRAYLGTATPATVAAGPGVRVVLVQRATTDGRKVARTENYVLVTVGSRPAECRNAWASAPCVPGRTSGQEQRLRCSVREVRQGSCANDMARACRCRSGVMCPDCASNAVCRNSIDDGTAHDWPYRAKPTLRCVLPPALGPDHNLNIYLHGIKTTLTHWYHPDPPVVTAVSPASVSYLGGDTITVTGRNFGPAASWTRSTAGGAQSIESAQARVELLGRAAALTCETVYVSDAQLLCKVPPLPRQRQPVDVSARTVAVDVVVRALGRRSARGPQAKVAYGGVPAYFMCPNVGPSAQSRSECYTCCRSACVVDQFALGVDFVPGAGALCGTSCADYCGGSAAAWAAGGRSLQRGSVAVAGY